MKEPHRHKPSDRNRRKACRQVARIEQELEYLSARLRRLATHLDYAISKTGKLRNRLRGERDG